MAHDGVVDRRVHDAEHAVAPAHVVRLRAFQRHVQQFLGVVADEFEERVLAGRRHLDAELGKLRAAAVLHAGVHTVVFERPGLQVKDAQELLKRAQKALEPLCAVVFSVVDGEAQIVIQVSPALVGKLKAGDLVKQLATQLGGGGGGRPEAAQGKGKDAARLPEARAAAIAAMQAAGLRA